MMMTRMARRMQQEGLVPTLSRAARALSYRMKEMRPSRRRVRRKLLQSHADYDRAHNVDTAGLIHFKSKTWNDQLAYLPVDEVDFRNVVPRVPIDLRQFTFVDLGSGKGKGLLMASEMPFRKIIGVEFGQELNDAAVRNIGSFRSTRQLCHDITAVCGDAATYVLPDLALVLFLFNPFGPEVMRPLLRNIEKWRDTSRHDLYVVYIRPHHANLWNDSSFVEVVESDPGWAIYRLTREIPLP